MLLTDRRVARGALVDVVAGAVGGGVRWVVLREKDLPRAERLALAVDLRAILAEAGGTLVVAGPDPLDGDAVHLPAAGPYPPPAVGLVGRSCHDTAELARLTTEHYATLSPVYETKTKPGHGPALRPAGLAVLVKASPVPVLALGGIETPDQVTACVEAGAAGVAVLGAIMRAQDPTETATTLGRAFQEAATRLVTSPARRGERPPETGLRPTVTTEGSSLTARSGHGRPQPRPQPPKNASGHGRPQPSTVTTGEDQ
ncbi:thiamine-phosphate pyrophosphorylase [Micromonospora sediminicola]|uniref:Thiamine-phosphate pyrophosphorylase n=1 Tax=Micromonospora sediminicola TaxID=946078 RepID=A0A1A9B4E1_9ACTN|nr:thiamine phosphate synthase [Micromonospora sediminicola]SBT64360.1 thiamine-phosphate pyrophosphorylase [Micromonospora sediminicola]